MSFAPVYLVHRFFFRLYDFFHHWYVHGTKFFMRRYLLALNSIELTFAVRLTFRHLADPLFGDYSAAGRIIGPIFRLFRAALGVFLYAIFTIIFALLYLAWVALPLYIIFNAARFAK